MGEFSAEIRGLLNVQKKLFKFSNTLGSAVTKTGLEHGAKYMKRVMKRTAPKKTGRLGNALIIRTSKINTRRKNGIVGIYLTVNAGRSRQDKKGAYYASWVEHGHRMGEGTHKKINERTDSREKVKGKFFVKRAFNRSKKTTTRLIIRSIEKQGKNLSQTLFNNR